MIQCKIFQANSKGVIEAQINKFLSENISIDIVNVLQSATDNGIVISIFYEENNDLMSRLHPALR